MSMRELEYPFNSDWDEKSDISDYALSLAQCDNPFEWSFGSVDGLERVANEVNMDTEMSIVINVNQYFIQNTGIAFFIW